MRGALHAQLSVFLRGSGWLLAAAPPSGFSSLCDMLFYLYFIFGFSFGFVLDYSLDLLVCGMFYDQFLFLPSKYFFCSSRFMINFYFYPLNIFFVPPSLQLIFIFAL